MEKGNFHRLIASLQQKSTYQSALRQATTKYAIKIYKISQLTPFKVSQLYETLQKKFYFNRKQSNQQSWLQNELRIFIWLLVGYLYIQQKELHQLKQSNWEFFIPIFNYRPMSFFQYQAMSLLKSNLKSPKWSTEELEMLCKIINTKNQKNKWNSIARQLFIKSNKKYFRNPKQCRERWMNHLDPIKIHSQWSHRQDSILMNCVKNRGKKWSIIVKQLNGTRTEHMVKNRYKSLIYVESKKSTNKNEAQLQGIILKRFPKIPEKEIIEQQVKQEESIGFINEQFDLEEENYQIEKYQFKNFMLQDEEPFYNEKESHCEAQSKLHFFDNQQLLYNNSPVGNWKNNFSSNLINFIDLYVPPEMEEDEEEELLKN